MAALLQVTKRSLEMYITQEELNKTQIPLCWRDYCAHLLPELNKCRMENYYKPWECKLERIAWQKCQYDEYIGLTQLSASNEEIVRQKSFRGTGTGIKHNGRIVS
jgi:NADH dehydrogenase (ubiquinone) 1 beta subcomplex subunit 7